MYMYITIQIVNSPLKYMVPECGIKYQLMHKDLHKQFIPLKNYIFNMNIIFDRICHTHISKRVGLKGQLAPHCVP